MSLANNPLYTVAFESKVHNLKLYVPVNISNGYHLSRNVAAEGQNIYSAGGSTKDFLSLLADEVKKRCNDSHSRKDMTGYMDINTLMDNLKYRLAYPIDEDCALRMGVVS